MKVKVYLLWEEYKCERDLLMNVTASKEEAEKWEAEAWQYYDEWELELEQPEKIEVNI